MTGEAEFAATGGIRIVDAPITSPDANALVGALLADLNERYGPGDFPPPDPRVFSAEGGGAFVVAYRGPEPVGCGGIFRVDDTTAEVKRMFTTGRARRRGVAGLVLAGLEERARALGYTRLRLETGARQPEAIAHYRRAGFLAIPPYPPYETDPLSRCFAKEI